MKDDPLISFRRKPATRNPASIDPSGLDQFAETLRSRVSRGKMFHCRITNDQELRDLNARFRGKDYATDVLSFPLDGAPAGASQAEEQSLGDIAISLQRARAQAREHGHTLDEELRILMLHGVLHLLGMDHESDSGEMARAESRWRKKLELPTGLIERVLA